MMESPAWRRSGRCPTTVSSHAWSVGQVGAARRAPRPWSGAQRSTTRGRSPSGARTQANAVRVEEVDRIGFAADMDRAEILDARFLDPVQYVVELLLVDGRKTHAASCRSRRGRPGLGALRDLEEGEQRVAPRIEKVVADVLERRVAAVAGAGSQARRDLERVPPAACRGTRR